MRLKYYSELLQHIGEKCSKIRAIEFKINVYTVEWTDCTTIVQPLSCSSIIFGTEKFKHTFVLPSITQTV